MAILDNPGNWGTVQSDHTRLVLARDSTTQDASEQGVAPDSRSSSNFCTIKSCSHRRKKGCHRSGSNQEQVANKQSE